MTYEEQTKKQIGGLVHDDGQDYYRKALEPALGKRVVLLGRFAWRNGRNKGVYEGRHFRKGNVCFVGIRPFDGLKRPEVLCHHLNMCYEDLEDAAVSPGALMPGRVYILMGIVSAYGDGGKRYGLRIDPTQPLSPVSPLGAFNDAYRRLAEAPGSYRFDQF